MIFPKRNFIIAALALLSVSSSFGYFQEEEAGQEIFSFSRSFQSPRNMALERSAAALSTTDPGIVQLNPAALELDENKKNVIAAYWQTGEFAENQGTISYSRAFTAMKLQFSYNWLEYGNIKGYDEYGDETGKNYSPLSQLITATSAFSLRHFTFGTTIKLATDKLADDSGDRTALALAFDWGFSWIPSATKRFGLTLVARDFGTMLRDYVDDGEDESYAMAETFAISGFFRPARFPRLTLLAETTFPRYSEEALNLGAEYILGSSFYIRAGFTRTWLDMSRDFKQLAASSSRPSESNEARLVSAGIGYLNSIFALDYAFSYLTQGLGLEHRVGLRVAF